MCILDVKVIIADDHPVVVFGIETVLAAAPRREFEVVGTARNIPKLLTQLDNHDCDVLITDFSMPNGYLPDGLSLISRIRRDYPHVHIVLLTTLTSTHTLRALLRLGVMGLYSKHESLAALPRAARLAAARRRYTSPNFQRLLNEPDDPPSPKELEVLRLLAKGLSSHDIAALTLRSEKTIGRQKRNAMDKLGLVHDGALLDYVTGRDVTG